MVTPSETYQRCMCPICLSVILIFPFPPPPPPFMPHWNCWYLKAMLDLRVRQLDVGAFMHQIFSFEAWSVFFRFWIWTRQSMHVIFEWFHRTSCMRCFDCVVMIMSDRFASESSVYSSHLSCVWIELFHRMSHAIFIRLAFGICEHETSFLFLD